MGSWKERCEKAIEEIKSLNTQLKQRDLVIADLQSNQASLNTQLKQKDVVIADLQSNQASFNHMAKIHQAYHENGVQEYLSDKLKLSDDENIVRTYIFFMQKSNLDSLWQWVREEAITNHEQAIFTTLKDFLYLVMEEFFNVHGKYAFIDEEIIANQNHMDYEIHPTSKTKRGDLSHIILHGYLNKNSNNILKKSIVTLK